MRVRIQTKSTAAKFKDHTFTCDRCPAPIRAGEKFYTWKHNHAPAKHRHQAHGGPRQSELCTGKMSGVYAAIEGAEDAIGEARKAGDISGLEGILNTAAEEIENVRQEYEDGLSNMPDSLQQSSSGEAIQEKIDGLESFKDELESAASECETFSSELDDLEAEHEDAPDNHGDDCPVKKVEDGDADEGECDCGKDDKETAAEENETEQHAKMDEAFERAESALQELSV